MVDGPFEKMCLAKVSRAVDLLSRVSSLELGQFAQSAVDARNDRESRHVHAKAIVRSKSNKNKKSANRKSEFEVEVRKMNRMRKRLTGRRCRPGGRVPNRPS